MMLLTKDAFYQGKKDGLYGLSNRECESHALNYEPNQRTAYFKGLICGMMGNHQARVEQRRFWNQSGRGLAR